MLNLYIEELDCIISERDNEKIYVSIFSFWRAKHNYDFVCFGLERHIKIVGLKNGSD